MSHTPAKPNQIYREIGRRIAAERKEKELTQEALAEKIDISRESVANIERGRQQLLVHHAISICDALDMEVADLLKPTASATRSIEEELSGLDPDAREFAKSAIQPKHKKRAI